MNAREADKQISQMIAFIKQEAKEKAEEIKVKTDSAFTAEKLSLQTQASVELRAEFENRKKDALAMRKKAESRELNAALFEKIKTRNDLIDKLKSHVLQRLQGISAHKDYPTLIKFLLVQGFMSTMEPKVTVRCREADVGVVQGQLEAAVKQFQALMKEATGFLVPVTPTLDSKTFLPPAPSPERRGESCCGGVLLYARGGKIKCSNTLDSRMEIAYHDLMPTIRGLLFGVRPEPENAWKPEDEQKHE
jgi:V-type H+-transporting ATPase subunit E